MKPFRILTLAALSTTLISQASAVVVWADDFTGEADGALPSNNFPGGAAGDDWGETNPPSATLSYTISGERLRHLDTATSGTNSNVSTVSRSHWSNAATLSSTTNILRFSADIQVDSFLASDNGNPRLILRDSATADNQFIVGWGRGTTTGDALLDELSFYAEAAPGTSSVLTPTNANNVGYNSPGFTFGTYNSTTDTANTTNGAYRITFEYDYNTGGVTGSITNLTSSQSASFTSSMNAGLDFDDAGTNDGLLLASGGNAVSDTYWDNISIEIIPEPSTLVLALAGLGTLFMRRRSA